MAKVLADRGFDLCDLYYRMSSKKNTRTLSAAGAGRLWRSFLAEKLKRSGGQLNLYVNVPFCATKCDFCGFYSRPGAGRAEVVKYTDAVIAEMKYFGGIFRNAKVDQLYIGGTPSYLSNAELARLLRAVFSEFTFTREGSRILECAPGSMTSAKVRTARSYGLNRINIGVQTLNEKVLRAINRPQKSSHVLGLIKEVNALGFGYGCNADLILGLEDAPGFLGSFSRVVKSGPETVSVYDLCPIGRYVDKFYKGDAVAARAEVARVRAAAEGPMLELAKKNGYLMICRNNSREWLFCKKDRFEKYSRHSTYSGEFSPFPSSTLGIGSSARSLMYGEYSYMQDAGVMQDFLPGAGLFTGSRVGRYEEMLKFIFVAFRTGLPVSPGKFKKRFGEDLAARFKEPLAELAVLKYVKITAKGVVLARTGPEDLFFCGLCLIGLRRFVRDVLPYFKTRAEESAGEKQGAGPRPGRAEQA